MGRNISRILITGGAGFVGSSIALAIRQSLKGVCVVAMDNLKRRGSEMILKRLRESGVEFLHGDVRMPEDFPEEEFDLMIECSAEPSVLAGYNTPPNYLLATNLMGAIHCFEFCRQRCPGIIFLSTSRVYSVKDLSSLHLKKQESRFVLEPNQILAGASRAGVAEDFSLRGPRSLYGTTKLSAELLLEEYREAYKVQALINRCGVIAGPWQMAKADQGIFTFWLANHYFQRPLRYLGFGGHGLQVRDLLHVDDLAELIVDQIGNFQKWDGITCNVGGGLECSLSLFETTHLCREITGNRVEIGNDPVNRPQDIPLYISDCRKLSTLTSWRPKRNPRQILSETYEWIRQHEPELKLIL